MEERLGRIDNPEAPLISAFMVVGRMAAWQVQLAVNCFANQTYPNRELVIINNCDSQYEAAGLELVLPRDARGRETAAVVDTDARLSAGMCKNYALSAANGEVLCQFDAHCWHAPERLETQLSVLLRNQAHVCVLSRALQYSYGSGYASRWENQKGALLNTMMFVRPRSDDYRDSDKLEELSLLTKMMASGHRPVTVDRPGLVIRQFFGGKLRRPVPLGDLGREELRLVRRVARSQALGD